MKRIFKYVIAPTEISSSVRVTMNEDAEVIHIAEQNGMLCLWVISDPVKQLRERSFYICGTGHPVFGLKYLGTAHCKPFVWHVFED